MRFNDAVVGLALVLFAIAEIAYSTTFPTLHGQAYGPSLFPTIIGCGLITCGLVLIARGLHQRRRAISLLQSAPNDSTDNTSWIHWGDWADNSQTRINMLLVPGLLVIYILLSEIIGFIPLSIVILVILLFRFGSSLVASIVIAGTTTTVLQLLFVNILLVPLPSGLLLHWLG